MSAEVATQKTSSVLEAIILALTIHVVFLAIIYFADEGFFVFNSKERPSEDVSIEFIELTEELLAVQSSPQPDLSSVLDKYKNVTASENAELSEEWKNYGFNRSRADEDVRQEVLDFEKSQFDKLKENHENYEYESSVKDDGESNSRKSNSSDAGANGNYAMATSTFDFSRDPEYRKTPTYLCRKFGKIVVEITVDRDGVVKQAKAISGDLDKDCLKEQSEAYAGRWKFKSDASATKLEKGTITFTFLPQKE